MRPHSAWEFLKRNSCDGYGKKRLENPQTRGLYKKEIVDRR